MNYYFTIITIMQNIPPDLLRYIVGFDTYTYKLIASIRRVCSNWNKSLSNTAIKLNQGLDSVVIHNGTPTIFVGNRTTSITWYGITEASIMAIANKCPNLQRAKVKSSYGITDVVIQVMANKWPNLLYIDLEICYCITDVSIQAIANNCTKLQHLGVSCSRITDVSIQIITNKYPNLQSLNLANTCITDVTLQAIINKCTKLQHLNIACSRITDAALQITANKCTNLQSLNITCCYSLTDVAIQNIRRTYPNLQIIRV